MTSHHHHLLRLVSRLILFAVAAAVFVAVYTAVLGRMHAHLERELVHARHTGPAAAYILTAPPSWEFDPTRNIYSVDILRHRSGNSTIFIEQIHDEALDSEAGRHALERSIKRQFTQSDRYTLSSFKNITWKGLPAFFMEGLRRDDTGTARFSQYVIFFPNTPHAYNITAAHAPEAAPAHEHAARAIIYSLSLAPHSE